MKPFTSHKGIVAPLDRQNVDTDAIIPKQFCKRIERTGFGQFVFYDWRFNEFGQEKADFILNQEAYRNASILLTRDNFGCGSSREHAPWAIHDYGFNVLISPSFADIFYNNCIKNGILPIILDVESINELFEKVNRIDRYQLKVNLEKQLISDELGYSIRFEIDSFTKHVLINGLDDITMTLAKESYIELFEKERPRWISH